MNMVSLASEFAIPVYDGPMPHALLPLRHHDRQPLRHDFALAWKHFNAFKQDKEKTSVAFCVFEALPWIEIDHAAESFLATDKGRAVYASEPYLYEVLDDRRLLRTYPKGSLAHDYCDFMEREGLTAAGLVAESETMRAGRARLDDRIEWYVDRQRDVHDLIHVLTSYGRDGLGEQCVAAFVFGQRPSWGHIFIAYAGALVTRHQLGTRAPVVRAVREAQKIGQKCPRIAEHSIRELLALPTAVVREMFGIRPPQLYDEVHRIWRAAGIEPS